MKKLSILALTTIILTTSSFATTCMKQYEIESQTKGDFIQGNGMVISAASMMLAFPLFALNPYIGVSYFVASATTSYISTVNHPLLALELLDVDSRPFYRLQRKAKKIDLNISDEKIRSIVEFGFNSGEFCKDEKLAKPREIKRYVLQQI